jgi:hypothetical protein
MKTLAALLGFAISSIASAEIRIPPDSIAQYMSDMGVHDTVACVFRASKTLLPQEFDVTLDMSIPNSPTVRASAHKASLVAAFRSVNSGTAIRVTGYRQDTKEKYAHLMVDQCTRVSP